MVQIDAKKAYLATIKTTNHYSIWINVHHNTKGTGVKPLKGTSISIMLVILKTEPI
jgi:hypothetical protein